MLRGTGSSSHKTLRELISGGAPLAITEIILAEVLSGATDANARSLRSRLLAFEVLPLHGLRDCERAAVLYRRCREAGRTPRSLTDCLIAIPTMRAGATLLHDDADFESIAAASDLQVRRA